MILFWFLSNCGLVLTNDSPAYSPDMLEVSQPVIIENKNELRSFNSVTFEKGTPPQMLIIFALIG